MHRQMSSLKPGAEPRGGTRARGRGPGKGSLEGAAASVTAQLRDQGNDVPQGRRVWNQLEQRLRRCGGTGTRGRRQVTARSASFVREPAAAWSLTREAPVLRFHPRVCSRAGIARFWGVSGGAWRSGGPSCAASGPRGRATQQTAHAPTSPVLEKDSLGRRGAAVSRAGRGAPSPDPRPDPSPPRAASNGDHRAAPRSAPRQAVSAEPGASGA